MMIELLLLILLLVLALFTVATPRIIRAAIGLALVSAVLAIIMFKAGATLAAVFELSVCAGLILVIFFITINFTQRMIPDEVKIRRRNKLIRYGILPIILLMMLMIVMRWQPGFETVFAPMVVSDAREVLWDVRHTDMLGQIVILLAGAFSVVVLFKGRKS